ncbi:hypothetical protein [Actinoallomurus sp. NPDC050550]|uniref:hypothetical protein n=1 Tax=Actinoallomurus sp. NPDC050550 TaxID=3154937 RepID=UPI0034087536
MVLAALVAWDRFSSFRSAARDSRVRAAKSLAADLADSDVAHLYRERCEVIAFASEDHVAILWLAPYRYYG